MMEWKEVELGDIMLKKGKSINPLKYSDEIFELYSIPAYDKQKPELLRGKEIGSTKKLLEPNDVILSRIVPHIRRCWVVGEKKGFIQIGSGEWIIFRNPQATPDFLRYFLLSDVFHSFFMKTVKGVGGSLLRADPKQVANFKIPLPPLETQRHIAQILDTADALRQKDQALLKQYDEFAQSLFLEMFGDPVTNPKGWGCRLLKQLVDFKGGGTPSKSNPDYYKGSIPWVTPKDMKQEFITTSIDKINEEAIRNSSAKLMAAGSVLMVVRSGILKKKLPLAINTVPVTVNQDMKVLISCDDINPYFLMYNLKVQSIKILQSVRATTADNISSEVLKKIIIALPPISLQNQFAERIEAIEAQKAVAQRAAQQSEDLFQALLQRAFKGELTA
jgi:type I restriction enzyme S subunit